MRTHLKVFLIAAVFGLSAYTAIRVLLYLSHELGLLNWLR